MAAEESFGVKIPDDEVKNLKTVGDAVAFIESAQGLKATPAVPPAGRSSVPDQTLHPHHPYEE